MNRSLLAGILGALLLISVLMGAYSAMSGPGDLGFSEADLHAPEPFSAPGPEPVPQTAGSIPTNPDVSMLISVGSMYAGYGGAVRATVMNNGSRALYLVDIAFEWVDLGLDSVLEVHRSITAGSSYTVRALAVDGPDIAGMYRYQMKLRLLTLRNGRWYSVSSGGDDWLEFSEHSIRVESPGEEHEYDTVMNPLTYYSRANKLVDFSSDEVELATATATAGLDGGYGIGQVCAIFDYVDSIITYTEDPNGGDTWYSPDDTLQSRQGDCEDYAMLLAAMVHDAGGTARMYLTSDHAFAAVYVGSTPDELAAALASVREYYGTDLELMYMDDGTGYWLALDPLGSFHPGGPAVGQVPTGRENGTWQYTFDGTDTLYVIDITGTAPIIPLWLDPNFWLGMILVFGFVSILALLPDAVGREARNKCLACGLELDADAPGTYTCPNCKAAYHGSCMPPGMPCLRCNAPVQYPPAPPPPPPAGR